MPKILNVSLLALIFIGLNVSCKKYPEGGKIKKAEKSLHGGLNEEYMKQWEVTIYEVDGIDSTRKWKEGKSQDRFSYYDVQISDDGGRLKIETEGLAYGGTLVDEKSILRISAIDYNATGTNCYRTNICERNIFMPDGKPSCDWTINQLSKGSLKITYKSSHTYIIAMEYADAE